MELKSQGCQRAWDQATQSRDNLSIVTKECLVCSYSGGGLVESVEEKWPSSEFFSVNREGRSSVESKFTKTM